MLWLLMPVAILWYLIVLSTINVRLYSALILYP